MEKNYNHKNVEEKIYKMWEDGGYFRPEICEEKRKELNLSVNKETFCVLMPPPNANAPLHCGHATYSIQDLMTRYKRMQGYRTLYVPGTDHAGFETQVVYERQLKKQNKSRFDFDSKTLFNDILSFVKENSTLAINQLKKLGMSSDWTRSTFMLSDQVLSTVYNTFEKMHKDGLIYRDVYLVNYSPYHGTTFSNLETIHIEATSPLYFVKYQIKNSNDYISVATVRPETIYGDVAIAVNPKDKRYTEYVGKVVTNPLNGREMKIIADDYVDLEFGTGALKITPGHDFNDYEIGRKHNLELISVIDLEGKMTQDAKDVAGMNIKSAREKSVEILRNKNALEKIDEKYTNNILVDYKDNKPIEPLLMPNWFVKMDKLALNALQAVKKDRVKFNLPVWKKEMISWLSNIRDWPISRQIVFGIRIPVWYNVDECGSSHIVFLDKNKNRIEGLGKNLLDKYSLEEIGQGLQKIIAGVDTKYLISKTRPGERFLQETDTFDTWFSSGQWPLTTLKYPDGEDFKKFFPTSFMDSMWDILFFWIARMIIFSLYLTKEIPFKQVFIHGRVDDEKGQKMSKSRGNVIDPITYVDKYGADALRMGLLVGGNPAAKTTSFSEDKVRGYRNFANKIWNIARFIEMSESDAQFDKNKLDYADDKQIIDDMEKLIKEVNTKLNKFKFNLAGDTIYHFIWHNLADKYLESIKKREDKKSAMTVLGYVFKNCIKLLHPFMPFVTEEIWQNLYKKDQKEPLIISSWPE
ncbi:valine--tRNA ligase [candidate division WWE3 bacterium RBG_19FT_COMBO_34_6]|uniref:Valine--tRNA ligase n=1 Tax=candidate division WWE3 bacterium RBG_19FT_COMBO_34_6 TaxID=1802612 RepID=A0A1F4UKR1_UNCKA|nr:MAG: valine--tRNA ligase [candidate division WWE3 bacterium RBG_19FT_COMBO_34_6]